MNQTHQLICTQDIRYGESCLASVCCSLLRVWCSRVAIAGFCNLVLPSGSDHHRCPIHPPIHPPKTSKAMHQFNSMLHSSRPQSAACAPGCSTSAERLGALRVHANDLRCAHLTPTPSVIMIHHHCHGTRMHTTSNALQQHCQYPWRSHPLQLCKSKKIKSFRHCSLASLSQSILHSRWLHSMHWTGNARNCLWADLLQTTWQNVQTCVGSNTVKTTVSRQTRYNRSLTLSLWHIWGGKK